MNKIKEALACLERAVFLIAQKSTGVFAEQLKDECAACRTAISEIQSTGGVSVSHEPIPKADAKWQVEATSQAFDLLQDSEDDISDWESGFLGSIRGGFDKYGSLTGKQFQTLMKICKEKTGRTWSPPVEKSEPSAEPEPAAKDDWNEVPF